MNSKDQFVSGAETWLAHSKEIATITLYEQRIISGSHPQLEPNPQPEKPPARPPLLRKSRSATPRLSKANRSRCSLRPPNPLNRNPKPPLSNPPPGSFVRAASSFVQAARSLLPKTISPLPKCLWRPPNCSQDRPQRSATLPDIEKCSPIPPCVPLIRPKCARPKGGRLRKP